MPSKKAHVSMLARKKGTTYRIRIWDPILNKLESKTVTPPEGMSGKKLDSWLQKQVDALESRVMYRTSTTSSNTPFGEYFLGEWFTEASKTNDEAGMYEYRMTYERHLEKTLGPVPLEKIVPRTIDCLYDELRAKGKSENFIYRINKLIGQVLGEAKRNGIIDVNVVRERMHAPRRERKDPFDDSKVLSPDETMIIIDAIRKEPLEWKTLCYTLIITGIRRGEVSALMWDCVDFKNNRIRICRAARRIPHKGVEIKGTKTFTSNRYVYITPDLKLLLLELKAKTSLNEGEFVFKGRKDPNGPLHPDSIGAHMSELSKRCGVKFSTHNLRSTFISTLISVLHIDPRTAQDVVGHSSIDVTMGIYARSKEDARRAAQQALEDYLTSKCSESMEALASGDDEA